MRALPGTSRTPARAGRTGRTAAWRVAVVAVLLALTAAGLRSRGTFSHAPDRVLAGASGTVLATALAATEGVALVAFVLVLVMARPRRKPKLDEDEPPRPPFPWWAKILAVLASVAVMVTPLAILLTRGTRPRTPAQARPGALASGGAVPPRLPAMAHGSPWPLIAGMLVALALLVALTAWSRHARRRPARPPGDQARLALGESLAAGRAALAGPRDPRAAIIACYAAVEHGFAAAGSAPGDGTGDDGQRGRLPRLPFDRLRPGVEPAFLAALPARHASAARPAGGRARSPGTGGSAAAARGRRRPRPGPGRAGPDDRRTGGAHVTEVLPVTVAETARLGERVLAEVEQVIVGKPEAVRLVLLGVLASGHILIEDLPGLGKTLLARTFATVLGLEFTRIQFTPDMLPADLLGATVLDLATGEAVFRPGPVFTGLLLADEINRTPPKTQAALLEAMAEGQVSTDGVTRPLPAPFVVLATDNPIEYEGTYPLPEAQLDRFIARVRLGYLDAGGEAEMLQRRLDRAADEVDLVPLASAAELIAMRRSLEQIEVAADLLEYVVALVNATRRDRQVQIGASPRGGLALVQLARGQALLNSRDYVVPDDIKQVAVPALAHRVTLRPELWVRQVSADDVVSKLLASVPTPKTDPAPKAGRAGVRTQATATTG